VVYVASASRHQTPASATRRVATNWYVDRRSESELRPCDSVAGSTLSGDKERQVTEGGDVLVLVRGDSRSGFMTTSSPVLKCPCEVPASEDQRELTSSTGCRTPEATSGVFRNSLGRSVGQSTVHASEVASSGTGLGPGGVWRRIQGPRAAQRAMAPAPV